MNQISRVSLQLHRVNVPLFCLLVCFSLRGRRLTAHWVFALKRLTALWIFFAINDQKILKFFF